MVAKVTPGSKVSSTPFPEIYTLLVSPLPSFHNTAISGTALRWINSKIVGHCLDLVIFPAAQTPDTQDYMYLRHKSIDSTELDRK